VQEHQLGGFSRPVNALDNKQASGNTMIAIPLHEEKDLNQGARD
jgi:hypothetical protein